MALPLIGFWTIEEIFFGSMAVGGAALVGQMAALGAHESGPTGELAPYVPPSVPTPNTTLVGKPDVHPYEMITRPTLGKHPIEEHHEALVKQLPEGANSMPKLFKIKL